MEPVEASESGDHLSAYGLSSSKTPPINNSLSTAMPSFNFIDQMTMAAAMYDQTGGTSSSTPNSSNSSNISSTNFRCTDPIPTPSTVSLAAAYAAASSNYPSSSALNGNNKSNHLHSHHHGQNGTTTNHHHNGQHLYPSNTDYGSSPVTSSNGYWPYSTQSYFPGTTRQYMGSQPPASCPLTATGVSDTSSSPSQQDLAYHTHGSYPHMQKMVGTYPASYEFYQQHNAKYC